MENDSKDLLELDFSLEETNNLHSINSILGELVIKISKNGVCRNDIFTLNNLLERPESDDYPLRSFTTEPSYVNLEIAQESMVDSMVKGFKKIMVIIFTTLSKFFSKLGEILTEASNRFSSKGREKEDVKTQVVIKALQDNSPEAVVDKKVFKNKINNKVVTGVTTERFLQLAYKDRSDREYKNIKEIMQDFFSKELTDLTWSEFIKNENSKLKVISDYAINWWNITHPIVAIGGNRSKEFITEVISLINIVVEKIVYRLNWWLNRIEDIAKTSPENIDNLLATLKEEKDSELIKINNILKSKLTKLFDLTPFIRVRIGNDLLTSTKNVLDTFKVSKVTPASKIDFIHSLDSLGWVNGIDVLGDKIKEGNDIIAQNEKESKKILDSLRKNYLKGDRTLITKVGSYLKEMKNENQNFIFLAAVLLSFVTFIESKVNENRKRGADLHFLIVSMGMDIEKHLASD